MPAVDPLPSLRAVLIGCVGAIFVAFGVVELFCTECGGNAVFVGLLKIAAGIALLVGPTVARPGNLRGILRFFGVRRRRGQPF